MRKREREKEREKPEGEGWVDRGIMTDNGAPLSTRDGRFGSKVGQIGPKWDKSGAFSDQISVHLAPPRQMH